MAFECVSSYDIFCSFIGEDVKVGGYSKSNTGKINPTSFYLSPKTKTRSGFKDSAWQGGNVFKFVKLFIISRKHKSERVH
jgi:hypothetical protein